ncbi:MAG: hydroxyethylthiazole kinase [Chthoniobacteraceae bacterium]|nr:hydroxyethylthiazole kinase [Chthoniobacteraceae bacterium]
MTNADSLPDRLGRDLLALREKAPLVHNITNLVVMNVTANALLALGASPIMAHAGEELEDLLGFASALVLNIGTLDSAWIASMEQAAAIAGKKGVPIVLDPVGAGASRLRTATALRLLQQGSPAIVRANPSEILALAGAAGVTKGVDSTHTTAEAETAARTLAQSAHCTVAVSGAVDFITDGQTAWRLSGGSPLMPRITGMGCTASALVGAFAGVSATPLQAAVAGMAVMKVAAEIAAESSEGPGTQQLYFLDALHRLTPEDLIRRMQLAPA